MDLRSWVFRATGGPRVSPASKKEGPFLRGATSKLCQVKRRVKSMPGGRTTETESEMKASSGNVS